MSLACALPIELPNAHLLAKSFAARKRCKFLIQWRLHSFRVCHFSCFARVVLRSQVLRGDGRLTDSQEATNASPKMYKSRAAQALHARNEDEWKAACAALVGMAHACDVTLPSVLAELRGLVASDAAARDMLTASTGLVSGLAGVLRPLCERACIPGTTDSSPAVAEAVMWLLGWLLPTPGNAAILHVRGDASLLLQLHLSGAVRGLRHAALVAFTMLHVTDGSSSDVAGAVGMLVACVWDCLRAVKARASANGSADDVPCTIWQAVSSLGAVGHLLAGRSLPHPDGPQIGAPGAGASLGRAAREAFHRAGGARLVAGTIAGAPSLDTPHRSSPMAVTRSRARLLSLIRTFSRH